MTGRTQRRAGALALAALAAGLGAEAGRMAVSGVLRLPGDPVLHAVRAGTPVSRAELDRLAASRRAARAWHARPNDATTAATADLLRLRRDPPTERAQPLRRAERALQGALAIAPADPHAWTRLALVRLALDAPADRSAAALAMAARTGPAAPELRALRQRLAARLAGGGPAPAPAQARGEAP